MKNPNTVRSATSDPRPIDAVDRRILTALAEDASRSYQALGELIGLSAPAVHDRVKRLRADGRILGTVARLDPSAVGKSLLAFVHIDTTGWVKSPELLELDRFPEVEEIHSVAGDTCMLVKVRLVDSHALEDLLERIYAVPGVVSTKSYVVLSTYLERTVQGAVTPDFGAAPPRRS